MAAPHLSRTLNGVVTNWTYDALGRLTTIGDPIGNFTYAYVGSTGRTSSVTYPNAQTTTYAYFPVNQDLRLQQIHHKKPGGATLNKFNYTYDAVGNILTWAQQTDADPAQTYTYEYDRVDQLTAATLAASTPKRYRYAYDPAGNRTVEQVDDAGTLSAHDNMNRLTSQVPGGGLSFRGTLSESATVSVGGKPASVSGTNQFGGTTPVPSGTSQVTVQATDPSGNVRTNVYELTQAGATRSFTHDANGNLTSDGVKTYFWDAANRLVEVKQGTTTLAAFTYDGEGRRASKSAGGVTISYVYEGPQFLEERPSAGSAKRYVYGLGIDRPLAQVVTGTTTYNVADHLGSVVRTTDAAGNPTITREYGPWGNPLQGAGTSGYAFTGREWDSETGLYYFRARYLDSKIGRFISEDPIGFKAGVNFYAYVSNNPLSKTDPFGLVECCDCPSQAWFLDSGWGFTIAGGLGFSGNFGHMVCAGRPWVRRPVVIRCTMAGPMLTVGVSGGFQLPGTPPAITGVCQLNPTGPPVSFTGWVFSAGPFTASTPSGGGRPTDFAAGATAGAGAAWQTCFVFPR